MPNCRTNLLGIQIVYCDEDGQRREVWLDIDRVKALAWCPEEVKDKSAGKKGNGKLPTDPNGPGQCRGQVRVDDTLCWWNGSEWVCGTED